MDENAVSHVGVSDQGPPPSAPALLADSQSRTAPARNLNGLAHWAYLSRVHLLVLGLAPAVIALATLWATGFTPLLLPALSAVLAVALTQAGSQLLDRYVEFKRAGMYMGGADARDPRDVAMLVQGVIPAAPTVLRASVALLALGVCAGIPLALSGGLPVVILGTLGLTTAILYSTTDFALKRLPMSDLAIALALGPGIACATVFGQRQSPGFMTVALGCSLGIFALALALATHWRDDDPEQVSGRTTITARIGWRTGTRLFAACLAVAYILVGASAAPNGSAHGALAVFLALPATIIPLTGGVRAVNSRAYRQIVWQTRRAYSIFAVCLLLGLLATGASIRIVPMLLPHFG